MRLKNPQRILIILCYVFIFETIQTDTKPGVSKASANPAAATSIIGRASMSGSTSGADTCRRLKGKKGDVEASTKGGPKKRITKSKSADLKDSGLPRCIITEITEILEKWSKSEESGHNATKTSKHTLIEYDTDDEEPPDKVPTPQNPLFLKVVVVDLDKNKKIFGSPDCIPHPPKNSNSGRRKRTARKKNCRLIYRWPRRKKPWCKEHADPAGNTLQTIYPKPVASPPDFPAVKDKAKFTVEIFEDETKEFYFNVSVSDHTKQENKTTIEEYENDDAYLIKVKKKKPSTKPLDYTYSMWKVSDLKPEEEDLLKQLTDLEKLKDIDTLVTIVWSQMKNDYCASEVIVKHVDDLSEFCEDLPQFLDFMKKKSQRRKDQKTSAVILKKDSPDYNFLFAEKGHFSFAYWYKLYTKTVTSGNFGGEHFVVSETVEKPKKGEYVQIQIITIIWDREEKNKGKLEVKLSYPKGGDPIVNLKFFKGAGAKRSKCLLRVRKLITPINPKVPQNYKTIEELQPKSDEEDEQPGNNGNEDGGDEEYEITEIHTSTSSNSSSHSSNETTFSQTIEDNDGKPFGKVGRGAIGTNLTYKGKRARRPRNKTISEMDNANTKV
ncbi:unnamed protein product [Allacma fusca]|uniref:Uncharacterized protein n=1 Tax=Allacma fusca TaxID=39272 RepID=A0A8J2L5J7_9HEXA|nr:unnamed protein product [Allacma fusca]